MSRDDEEYGLWDRDEVKQEEVSDIEFLRWENGYLKSKLESLEGIEVRLHQDSLLVDSFRSFLHAEWTLKSLLKDVEDFVRSRPFYASRCEEKNVGVIDDEQQ